MSIPASHHRSRRKLQVLAAALLAGALVATPLAIADSSTAAPRIPAKSTAEPDTERLAGDLVDQPLNWTKDCPYGSDAAKAAAKKADALARAETGTAGKRTSSHPAKTAGKSAELPRGVLCATIDVPRDWHNPDDGNTIEVTLELARRKTSEPGHQGIALVNPGGPGSRGLGSGTILALADDALWDKIDFVSFDPRGVGASTPLNCTYTVPDEWDDDEVTRRRYEACQKNPLTKYITTEQTAYDIDFIRVLLGQPRTSYVGYSYGTWLGAWYAATFPSKTHRVLLDSATDTTSGSLQRTWDLQPIARERQFQDALLPYIARHDDVYGLGTDPAVIREKWEAGGGSKTFEGQFSMAFFIIPATYDTSLYPSAAKAIVEVAKEGLKGPGSTATKMEKLTQRILSGAGLDADQRAFVKGARTEALAALKKRQAQAGTTETFNGTFDAIRCQDGQWNQDPAHWEEWKQHLEREASSMAPFYHTPMCSLWKTNHRMPEPDPATFPKALIAQSELDGATAYEGALATAQKLPGVKVISVDNEGSHGMFPYGTPCVDDPIKKYLLTGEQPARRFNVCQAAPLPDETEVYEVGDPLVPSGKVKRPEVTEEMKMLRNMLREVNSPHQQLR
ncbi:alpha/beta fold hydrolase [Streptomyces sp. VB1]|uniref:alpha/beta fold hydrolase n=1 Tax=Streptomyces sp. VB1 TaxID=2986803 RepID=UPI002241C536|nr:alpha/beta fold hydrolase [Streptomyces sp. VB1]UZI32778.1 alpha/beta hydrolase [Streptomyces sp. VB1]